MALVLVVAHRDPTVAAGWVAALARGGYLALAIDPEALPPRPAVIDGVAVEAALPASRVEALRSWAGAQVPLSLVEGEVEDGWLQDLTRLSAPPLRLEGCQVDLRRGVLQRGGAVHVLSDTEAMLLAWLASRPGRVVSRDELLQRVWGYSPAMRTRVVDVTVARLRAKLEADAANPTLLLTVRGRGYRLEVPEVPEVPAAPPAADDPDLVGRDEIRALLHRWLRADERLITLLGPPGIGKTRLARAVASAVPGFVWCGLADAASEPEALEIVAEALRLAPGTAEAQVAAAVQRSSLPLLVLDNGEHVLGLLGRLLAEAPQRPVLVTSRVRLALPHERSLDLRPLDREAAAVLFLRRADRRRHDHATDRETLSGVLDACEGLPLALELAAARVAVTSGPDLVRSLGTPDATYQRALDASFALLDPPESAALARLAAVPGDLPMALVEELLDDALTAVGALQDASLVQVAHRPEGAVLHLLETVRRYVARRDALTADDALDLARRIERYAARIDASAREPDGWEAVQQLGRIRRAVFFGAEAALGAGAPELADRLGLCLTHRYEVYGASEADLRLLARLGCDRNAALARLLALLQVQVGRHDEAARLVARARALATDPSELAEAAYADVMVRCRRGDSESSELAARLDDLRAPVPRARALIALGLAALFRGDGDVASGALTDALAVADRAGIGWLQANVLSLLVNIYLQQGRFERALASARAVEQAYRDAGVWSRVGVLGAQQGIALLKLGRPDEAVEVLDAGLALVVEQGRVWDEASMVRVLCEAELERGEPEAAREAAWRCERLLRAIGGTVRLGLVAVMNAEADLALGDARAARSAAEAHLGDPEHHTRCYAVEQAVLANLTLGDVDRAAAVLAASELSGDAASGLAMLVDAAAGRPPSVALAPSAPERFRVWAGLLGGPEVEPRTPRGRALWRACKDGVGAPFAEVPLALALRRAGRL